VHRAAQGTEGTGIHTSLSTSLDYGIHPGMGEMRKITVEVPSKDLKSAQAYTGEGISETVRAALRKLASIRAQQALLKLRGKVKFSLSLEELREDRE